MIKFPSVDFLSFKYWTCSKEVQIRAAALEGGKSLGNAASVSGMNGKKKKKKGEVENEKNKIK